MTEGRIQDWIRYVQDRAEYVEGSQENPDVSTQDNSAADESPLHNTSQPASQQPLTPPSDQTLPKSAPAPSANLLSPPQGALPPREALPSREGRVLPSLTAQAVRRSVARARALANAPAPEIAPPSEADVREDAAEFLPQKNAVDEVILPESPIAENVVTETPVIAPRTRRGRRSSGKSKVTELSSEAKVRQRVRQRPETRAEMLDRLMNPTISLYEASVLLDVCSATVRRYTNSGLLPHERTEGGQRRFRLRDVLMLLKEQESRKS